MIVQEAFQKVYPSIRDELVRKKLFVANALKTFAHNLSFRLGLTTYYLSVNQFSDNTPQEIKNRYGYYPGLPINGEQQLETTETTINNEQRGISQPEPEPEILSLEQLQYELARIIEEKQPGYQFLSQQLELQINGKSKRSKRSLANSKKKRRIESKKRRLRRNKKKNENIKQHLDVEINDFRSLIEDPILEESEKYVEEVPTTNIDYEPIQKHVLKMRISSGKQSPNLVSIQQTSLLDKVPGVSFVKEKLSSLRSLWYGNMQSTGNENKAPKDLILSGKTTEVQPSTNDDHHALNEGDTNNNFRLQAEPSNIEEALPKEQLNLFEKIPSNSSIRKQLNPLLLAISSFGSSFKDESEDEDEDRDVVSSADKSSLDYDLTKGEDNSDIDNETGSVESNLAGAEIGATSEEISTTADSNNEQPDDNPPSLTKESTNMTYWDWRDSNCLTVPRDQGACNSCYAFSTIAVLEWLHCRDTGDLVPFSEQYMLDCGKHVGLVGCIGGQFNPIAQFIQDWGVELRSNYPYEGHDGVCPYAKDEWHKAGYKKPVRINARWETDRTQWARIIEDIGPMLASIRVPDDFAFYGGLVHKGHNCATMSGYHMVLLVGHGIEDGEEYWLIRNSHGATWGDSGYFKLSKNAQEHCFYIVLEFNYGFIERTPPPSEDNVIAAEDGADKKEA